MRLPFTGSIDLRPFQHKALVEIDRSFSNHSRVLLVAPTGSGKTVIAGCLAALVVKRLRQRCVFLVHRRELMAQAVGTLQQFGLGDFTGTIGGGSIENAWAPFIVASIPTLARNKLRLKADFVIVDEAHHINARTWGDTILERWPEANILGMTATPRRTDGQAMGNFFETIVQTPQIKDLVKAGYLCDFDMLRPPYALKPNKDLSRSTRKKTIVQVFESWRKHASGRKTIIFAVDIAHSKELKRTFRENGVSCEHIDASTQRDKRDWIIADFRRGDLQVITNVNLISEGFDVPDCGCVVMARPSKSIIDYFQQAGRMMRPKKSGEKGILLDLAGNVFIHGYTPKDVVEWSLEGLPNPGIKVPETKPIAYHVCEICVRPYNSIKLQCPYCGHERSRAGQLIDEIEASLVLHQRPEKSVKNAFGELVHDFSRRTSFQDIVNEAYSNRKTDI